MRKKYFVQLSEKEREYAQQIITSRKHSTNLKKRANVLLMQLVLCGESRVLARTEQKLYLLIRYLRISGRRVQKDQVDRWLQVRCCVLWKL